MPSRSAVRRHSGTESDHNGKPNAGIQSTPKGQSRHYAPPNARESLRALHMTPGTDSQENKSRDKTRKNDPPHEPILPEDHDARVLRLGHRRDSAILLHAVELRFQAAVVVEVSEGHLPADRIAAGDGRNPGKVGERIGGEVVSTRQR